MRESSHLVNFLETMVTAAVIFGMLMAIFHAFEQRQNTQYAEIFTIEYYEKSLNTTSVIDASVSTPALPSLPLCRDTKSLAPLNTVSPVALMNAPHMRTPQYKTQWNTPVLLDPPITA